MGKIIVVANQKGGVGKTTLLFNIINNISANSKAGVLDFDVQGSLSQLKDLVSNFDIIQFKGNIDDISKMDYDFLFLDTPPYLSQETQRLIEIADLIIIPIKPAILDLLAIKNTLELIEQSNKKDNALIVFNMVKVNSTLTLDILIGLEEYNVNIAKTHISDLVAFSRSVLLKGVGNDKNAQRQIDNLTKEILIKLI